MIRKFPLIEYFVNNIHQVEIIVSYRFFLSFVNKNIRVFICRSKQNGGKEFPPFNKCSQI